MKIVIDISNDEYQVALAKMLLIFRGYKFITLPKGHGRLIDADSLIKTIEEKAKRLSNADTINGLCGAVALIFDEQTIIEADRAESEE